MVLPPTKNLSVIPRTSNVVHTDGCTSIDDTGYNNRTITDKEGSLLVESSSGAACRLCAPIWKRLPSCLQLRTAID